MKVLPKTPGQLYFRGLALDGEISSRGWNVQNLKQVYRTFSGIAQNYARLAGQSRPYDVMLMKQCDGYREAAVGVDSNTIYVFLRPGPKIVNRLGTLALARELSAELFERAGILDQESFRKKASIPLFHSLVDRCARALEYYLSRERYLPADRDNIREIIEVLGGSLSFKIMKIKTSYLLLHPRLPSRRQVTGEIGSQVRELEKESSAVEMEEDLIFSWRAVGTLAMLSLVARKFGCAQSALDCQGRLWGKLGRDLAVVEMGTLLSDFQELLGTHTLETLRRVSLPEFNILFNGLLPIFDLYFDSTEAVLRRLTS